MTSLPCKSDTSCERSVYRTLCVCLLASIIVRAWMRVCVCLSPELHSGCVLSSRGLVVCQSVCLSDSISIVCQLISSTAVLRCAVRGSMPGRSPLFTSIHFSSLLVSFVVFQRHSPSLFNSVKPAQLIKLSLTLFINTSPTS